jgi:hypothetical protein
MMEMFKDATIVLIKTLIRGIRGILTNLWHPLTITTGLLNLTLTDGLMREMFDRATSFNQDVDSWDTWDTSKFL